MMDHKEIAESIRNGSARLSRKALADIITLMGDSYDKRTEAYFALLASSRELEAEIERMRPVVEALDRYMRNATDENMAALGAARRNLNNHPGLRP